MPIAAAYDPFAFTDAAFGEESDDMLAEVIDIATTRVKVAPAPLVRCLGCGRQIRSALALARGYGAGCWAKAHRRDRTAELAADGYTPTQIADAVELVEDGGVIHLRGTVYLTVGHRGDVYRTTVDTCACAAGLRGNRCFHTAAVRLVAGVEPTARTPIALPSRYTVAA